MNVGLVVALAIIIARNPVALLVGLQRLPIGRAVVAAVSMNRLADLLPIRAGVDPRLEVVHVALVGGGDFQYAQ